MFTHVAKLENKSSQTVSGNGCNTRGRHLPLSKLQGIGVTDMHLQLSPITSPKATGAPVEQEPCEDAIALFPSQLASPLNAAQNLVQPISDPAPMNQDLGDWQKLMKKLKDRQAKMAAEQAKPNPNPNKLNNLQAEANATQAEIDGVTPRIQNRVSQMDSARPALRSALNSVAQAPDFSQDAHADVQANPLPQTLEEYREAIASLVDEFDARVSSENTYDHDSVTAS